LIGQAKIKDRLQRLVEEKKYPNFSMIVAPKGHGKRELAQYVRWMLEADIFIPEDLKVDSIRSIIEDGQALSKKRVYLLADSDEMTIAAQNALLKFSEEPPKNAYIIMTVEDDMAVLETIKSRAKVFHMETYTKEELGLFFSHELPSSEYIFDEIILEIAENPGQILKLVEAKYDGILVGCNRVVENIGKVSAANAFSILKHFHETQHEFIIPMLLHLYGEELKEDNSSNELQYLCKMIQVVYKYKGLMKNKSVNKVNLLEMMFIEMRETAWSLTY
jgi:hypothetical protein